MQDNNSINWKEVYQRLYEDDSLNYGKHACNRCPGARYFPLFKTKILSPVVDLGCGTGDTVEVLRANGFEAEGVDFIDLKNGMHVNDITKPMNLSKFNSAICMDVMEHLSDEQCMQVLMNLRATRTQIITTCSSPSIEKGTRIDLHINKKSAQDWAAMFGAYLIVETYIELHPSRYLFYLNYPNCDSWREHIKHSAQEGWIPKEFV